MIPQSQQDLYNLVRTLEQEIRKLKNWRQAVGTFTGLRATSLEGTVSTSQGGTGQTDGPSRVVPILVNNSGVTLVNGDLVVLDLTVPRQITRTTIVGDRLTLGVVSGTGSYANGAETPVLVLGYHQSVKVTGTVSAGDYLRSSATIGVAESAGVDASDGVFGIALDADNGGVVPAFIQTSKELGAFASDLGLTLYIPFGSAFPNGDQG